MIEIKSAIELKYIKEFKLGNTKLIYEEWLKNRIKIYTEELDKQLPKINKEKQKFQLGDIAYMIDEDYRFFESEVKRIDLDKEKYFYTTDDADFEFKNIGQWVFTSEMYRELHLEVMR